MSGKVHWCTSHMMMMMIIIIIYHSNWNQPFHNAVFGLQIDFRLSSQPWRVYRADHYMYYSAPQCIINMVLTVVAVPCSSVTVNIVFISQVLLSILLCMIFCYVVSPMLYIRGFYPYDAMLAQVLAVVM